MFRDRTPWWKKQAPEAPPEPVMPMSVWLLVARCLWSAVPDFALAGLFLLTWVRPYAFDEEMVHHLMFVMLLEFLVVHSTGFLGAVSDRGNTRWERVFMLSVLLLLYSLFAAAFSVSYGGPWPFIAFMYLTLSKVPNIIFRGTSADKMMGVMANWATMVALYLFGCFATLMYDVPPLGVTPEVIARQGFTVGGEWPEQPYRVMAFGAIYFTGLGIVSVINEVITYFSTNRQARVEAELRRRHGGNRAGA